MPIATYHGVNMKIARLPVNAESLAKYSTIPISFEAMSRLDVEVVNNGLGGIVLREETLGSLFKKDYDQLEEDGLKRWLTQFDTSNWTMFLVLEDSIAVGGATLAFWTPGIWMFERRRDVAVLWDIRVLPNLRRSGIGSALFAEVVRWSKDHGCQFLKVVI
jgi:GNAT superfamily N-acetyltransferase